MGELILSKLKNDVYSFDCGNNSINRLVYESYYATLLRYAYGFKIDYYNNPIGYFMVCLRDFEVNMLSERFSDYESILSNKCYSIHIKYIAIDKKFQRHGIGTKIIHTIISETIKKSDNNLPIRMITLDAIKEKITWYENIGFKKLYDEDDDTLSSTVIMYIDCINDYSIFDEYNSV